MTRFRESRLLAQFLQAGRVPAMPMDGFGHPRQDPAAGGPAREIRLYPGVPLPVVQHRERGVPVPAAAADLLVVGVQGAGQRGVQDVPYVLLVDAHAERRGRHDDVGLAGQEGTVDAGAFAGAQSGVVGLGGQPQRGEFVRVPCAVLPGRRVDDAGLGFGGGPLDHGLPALVLVEEAADLQPDVRPVEPGDHQPGPAHAQTLGDLPAHGRGRGRGRGQGQHGRSAHTVRGLLQTQVVGAEVVAPRGDALGLVHHEQGRPDPGQRLHHVVAGELLRGQTDETGPARPYVLPGRLGLRRAQVRVDRDGPRGVVALGKTRDLVPLEREQR
ncbi:hypothetical protein GCM10010345_05030 [Streptomyces canarius]|uniref:Uncharacterized protein n=1 Tax=Streptomyces canarius TaxID=285453 RepID=A0ABQ3CGZ6_9ACTN|nr:hypothetical protein GCM10010345_05030 [Streptomyces canarius]